MTTLPMTAAELHQLADEFVRNAIAGGFMPTGMSDEELGERAVAAFQSEEAGSIGNFIAQIHSGDPAGLGQSVRMFARCGELEQQILQHQAHYQISGVLSKTFTFDPLDYRAEVLRLGLWLKPIGNDGELLHANALELTASFKRLAEGRGSRWLKYRQINFELQDGTGAWRFNRSSWSGLDAAAAGASHATLRTGLVLIGDDQSDHHAVELTLWADGSWPGAEDGDTQSFQLVDPNYLNVVDLNAEDRWWC